MWAILNQLLLLLVITSPLVGMFVVAMGLRWGAGRDAIREAVVANAWLTVALVGLVVAAFRIPDISRGDDSGESQLPALQLYGSMRWIGDSAIREVPEKTEAADESPTSATEEVHPPPQEFATPVRVLPVVRMAWGIDGIRICFLAISAIAMVPMFLIPPSRSSETSTADRKSDAGWYIGLLGIGASTLALLTAQDVVWLLVAVAWLVLSTTYVVGEWGGAERRNAMSSVVVRWGMGSLAVGLALMGLVYALAWMQFWGGETQFTPNHLWQRIHVENISRRFFDPVADHLWRQMSPAIGLLFCVGAYFWLPIVPVHRSWIRFWSQAPAALRLFWLSAGSQLGLFGLVGFVLPLFGPLSETAVQICGAIGLSGYLYSLCLMSRQTTLVQALMYATLAQQGLCFAALTCGERSALWGGLLQIISFSLSCGVIVWQRSTESPDRNTIYANPTDAAQLRRANGWPRWSMQIAEGSLCGMPGTLGFIAQLLILWGLFRSPVNGELIFMTLVGWVFSSGIWQRTLTLPLESMVTTIPIADGEELAYPQRAESDYRGWSAFGYASIVSVILLATGLSPALILDRLKPSTQYLALVQNDKVNSRPLVTDENNSRSARCPSEFGDRTRDVKRERQP